MTEEKQTEQPTNPPTHPTNQQIKTNQPNNQATSKPLNEPTKQQHIIINQSLVLNEPSNAQQQLSIPQFQKSRNYDQNQRDFKQMCATNATPNEMTA